MTSTQKLRCEVCGRAIRRNHSHVQITEDRRRHHVCHEREERVTAAREGQPFNGVGADTVGPKCDTNSGAWFCNTHRKGFTNNLQKDIHIGSGSHELVWLCFEHGPEEP